MEQDGQFRPATASEASIGKSDLEALVTGPEDRLTFLCTPWGSGERIGLDRDLDGVLDGDEI